jgi:hypothetical protein
MMDLKIDDSVITETGEVGNVVHIDRLTVYVKFPTTEEIPDIRGFLKSTLTLVVSPTEECR